jgi:hypothetical protein
MPERSLTQPPMSATYALSPLWEKVDQILDRLTVEAARAHGVIPLFTERLRARGEEVPPELLQEERAARMANAIAPSVLVRAREAYDGRMMLLKGPEVSALYPGRARMLADLDLLVDDAPRAREAFLEAGFVSADRLKQVSDTFYHVNPVELPGIPLPIELHKSFRWPNGLRPAPNDDLFAEAVPATVGVAGLVAPSRAHHAVLLATHGWAERPLERLRDLIDIEAMAEGIDERELSQVAEAWGWGRLWQATRGTRSWLFEGGPRPSAARVWARHLEQPRAANAVDRGLAQWLSPFWALPFPTAVHEVGFVAKKAALRHRKG